MVLTVQSVRTLMFYENSDRVKFFEVTEKVQLCVMSYKSLSSPNSIISRGQLAPVPFGMFNLLNLVV